MPDTHDLSNATDGHMTDADRLMDCMCSSKERALLYANGALECTNNGVREFFLAMHGEETHNQEILFSFLHTRGFYPVKMAEQSTIRETASRYRTMHDQMGVTDKPSDRRYQTADPHLPPAHTQNPESYQYKNEH